MQHKCKFFTSSNNGQRDECEFVADDFWFQNREFKSVFDESRRAYFVCTDPKKSLAFIYFLFDYNRIQNQGSVAPGQEEPRYLTLISDSLSLFFCHNRSCRTNGKKLQPMLTITLQPTLLRNISKLQTECAENRWYTPLVNGCKTRRNGNESQTAAPRRWQARFTKAKILFGLIYFIGFGRANTFFATPIATYLAASSHAVATIISCPYIFT